MDVLEFLNSVDVREHLKKTGYRPSLLEAAYFIYNNKTKPMDEKFKAFNELLEETDDMILDEKAGWRWGREGIKNIVFMPATYGMSAHGLIKRYMSEQRQLWAFFLNKDPAFVYTCLIKRRIKYNIEDIREINCDNEEDFIFADYESAYEHCIARISEDEDGEYIGFTISKRPLARPIVKFPPRILAEHNRGGGIVSIEEEYVRYMEDVFPESIRSILKARDELDTEIDFFKKMWFDIPVPFKKGDIVVGNPYCWEPYHTPFVYIRSVPEYWREQRDKGHEWHEGYDSSDMNAGGWMVGYGNNKVEIYDDMRTDYLDLEYYRGRYEGYERLLPLVAEVVKNDLDLWQYERIKNEIIQESGGDSWVKTIAEYDKIISGIMEGTPTFEEDVNS